MSGKDGEKYWMQDMVGVEDDRFEKFCISFADKVSIKKTIRRQVVQSD